MHAKHVPFDGEKYTHTNNRAHPSTFAALYQHMHVYSVHNQYWYFFKKQNTATQQIKLSVTWKVLTKNTLLELIRLQEQNKLTWSTHSCVLVEALSVQYYQDRHQVWKPHYYSSYNSTRPLANIMCNQAGLVQQRVSIIFNYPKEIYALKNFKS